MSLSKALPVEKVDRLCRIVWALGIAATVLKFATTVIASVSAGTVIDSSVTSLIGFGASTAIFVIAGVSNALVDILWALAELGALRLLIVVVQRTARDGA